MVGTPPIYDPREQELVPTTAIDTSGGAALGQTIANAKRPSIGDKINDWLHAPGTAAALFRSGAETLRNGFGSGLAAGAGYMDEQKQAEAKSAQNAIENLFRQQQVDQGQQQIDQTGQYQTGQLGLGVARQEEDVAARRSRDTLTARGQDVQRRGQDVGLQNDREGRQVQVYGIDQNTASGLAREQMGNDTTRYVADRGADSREQVAATRGAGIGSKAPKSAPAAIQKQAVVLPANATANDLEAGKIYRTARGLGQWDGAKFLPVN